MARILLVLVLLLTTGCSWLKPQPTPILPPEELYQLGESELEKKRYAEAREQFRKVVERHPNSSYAPRARFLMGEAFYREAEFDKAVKEFETFLSFYPRHQVADLVQYRLAMSYYDQLKPVEQDQALTVKAMDQFKKLVREYPESRYAGDGLAKIEVCRGRLAQKELWVAAYYFETENNPAAARARLEGVLKDYPRTLIVPEAMYRLADLNAREGRAAEAQDLFRKLADDFSHTEWGKRATQRLRTAATR